MTKVHSDLLKKYNVPGPRYTSYPTVPYWDTNPTAEQWIQSIDQALTEAERIDVGAALYLHIPFCQSLCTYCGCNTRITRNRAVGLPYIQTIQKEWQIYLDRLGYSKSRSRIPLTEIHLGGGTPTFLSPEELKQLLSGVLETVDIKRDHEFSTEADPRVTSQEHLAVLAQLGFKRLSLGVQDFDPHVQEMVHRIQSEEQTRATTESARELGFTSINYDLIYGLPFQTKKSVESTVEAVTRLRPDRIAFYAYAHVPWIKPSQRRFTEADLPTGDEKRALYELGRRMLEDVGYKEVGMDHFALETDSLWTSSKTGKLHRNFMGYTARNVAPMIGLGVSAIGDSWRIFAQNEKLLETYQSRIEKNELPLLRGHVLTQEDLALRKHILNLMTQMKTTWSQDQDTWNEYLDSVPRRLQEMEKDGLVHLSSGSCEVTEEGRPFLRNICMAFDARLVRQAPATQLFSKTI